MATSEGLVVVCFLFFLRHTSALGVFADILGDTGGCEEMCDRTYPLHTYDTALHLSYCHRGCRLFTIIDFVNDEDNLNATKEACAASCREAYQQDADAVACVVGCDAQYPFAVKRERELQQYMMHDSPFDAVYPLLYVHNLYSNMVDKLSQHISVSWSYYMGSGNGQLVVVRSEPQIMLDEISLSSQDSDYKTSNYMETNIAAVDNSATPNLKHSQMPLASEHDISSLPMTAQEEEREDGTTDWLGCVAKKTGIPRLLLSFTIFISAMVMIWLCFTTAATAPEQRVPAQKLSIYGDLDYLHQLNDKSLLASVHPQERTDFSKASALPIKIKVDRI